MKRSSNSSSLFALSFLLLAVLACNIGGSKKKESEPIPIPDDKKNYVGDWNGEFEKGSMILSITSDGTVNYERKESTGGFFDRIKTNSFVNGKITKFDGDDFEVTVLSEPTNFKVEKPPYHENDLWKMVVDGVELSRPGALTIRTAEMRKDDGAGNFTEEATDTFAQSEQHIHSIINWDNPRAGTRIRFVYIAVDAGGAKNEEFSESKVATKNDSDDEARDRLNIKRPLPKGSYKVDIYVNDKLEASLPFKIV